MTDSAGVHTRSVSPSWEDDRERILARYLTLLFDAQSPLIQAGEAVTAQLTMQLYAIIDTVHARLGRRMTPFAEHPPVSAAGSHALSDDIGRQRASAGIHPSNSLQAAALIFQAALPIMSGRLRGQGAPEPETAAAVALNEEILRRMSSAASGYVEYLLTRAHTSNWGERRRLSRELHDVAAPAVAVALQNLELFDIYAETDPETAATKMETARKTLLEAFTTIRTLSAQSRESVEQGGLIRAVQRDLEGVPTDIQTALTVDGDPDALPPCYADDLFLIVREAIRNAAEHADPRRIHVRLSASRNGIEAWVSDDGTGFDVHRTYVRGSRHVGIDSMHERAAHIGAEIAIVSRPSGAVAPSAVVDGQAHPVGAEIASLPPAIADAAMPDAGGTIVSIRMSAPNGFDVDDPVSYGTRHGPIR